MTGFEPPRSANASLLMPSGLFIFSGLALPVGWPRSSPAGPRATPRMSLTSAMAYRLPQALAKKRRVCASVHKV